MVYKFQRGYGVHESFLSRRRMHDLITNSLAKKVTMYQRQNNPNSDVSLQDARKKFKQIGSEKLVNHFEGLRLRDGIFKGVDGDWEKYYLINHHSGHERRKFITNFIMFLSVGKNKSENNFNMFDSLLSFTNICLELYIFQLLDFNKLNG